MLEYVPIVVILITVVFDALRDGFQDDQNWWKRHIVKWVQFYVPLGYILFTQLKEHWWIILPIPCWIIWRLSLRYIAHVYWESMWFRWFKIN